MSGCATAIHVLAELALSVLIRPGQGKDKEHLSSCRPRRLVSCLRGALVALRDAGVLPPELDPHLSALQVVIRPCTVSRDGSAPSVSDTDRFKHKLFQTSSDRSVVNFAFDCGRNKKSEVWG